MTQPDGETLTRTTEHEQDEIPSRRRRDRRPVRLPRGLVAVVSWLPILALVLVAVGPALVGQRVFLATDFIETATPWAESSTVTEVQNRCVNDTIDSAMPAALNFRERVAGGELLPDFASKPSAGNVQGANPSVGLSSPIFLATLPFSDTTFTAWLKVFEIVVMMAGMILWGRRIGLSAPAGVLGGFLFVTSAYMVQWTNWPQTRTAAFFPLLFWALERIIQDRTLRSVLPLPLVVVGLALGGFPAIVVHTVYVAAVYAVVRLIVVNRERDRSGEQPARGVRRWVVPPALAVAGGVLAVGMVAFQLAPWAAQLASQDLGYRSDWWADTIPDEWLLTLAYGQGLGTCSTEALWWGARTIPVEAVAFVGAAALAMVLVALVHRTRVARGVVAVLITAALLSLAVTYVGGLFNEVLHHLPGMGSSRMWRTRAVGGMAFAMVAAIGFDTLLRTTAPTGRRRWVATAVAGLYALALVAGAWGLRSFSVRPEGWFEVRPSVLLSLASGLAACAIWVAVLWYRRGRSKLVAMAVAVLLPLGMGAEGVVSARMWWPLGQPDQLYREVPTSAWLREHLGSERIFARGAGYFASGASVHGLRSLSGHSFVPPEWADMIRQGDPMGLPSQTNTFVALSDMNYAASPVLSRFAVKYAVDDTGGLPPGELQGFEEVNITSTVPAQEAVRPLLPGRLVRSAAFGIDTTVFPDGPLCEPEARFEAQILDAQGNVLVENSRRARFTPHHASIYNLPMDPVPAEALDSQAQLRVRVVGCGNLPMMNLLPYVRNHEPRPDVTAVPAMVPWVGAIMEPEGGDGMRVVPPSMTPDALVVENLLALPRIRWATSSAECSTARQCATLMGTESAQTVMLSPQDAQEVPFSGEPARIDILADADDSQVFRVQAEGEGMLVVADAVQAGWKAYLDGEPTTLRTVDGAMRGVAVPAGEHEVRFSYEPLGRRVLGPVAVGSALLWLGAAVTLVWRDRRRAARELS